MRMPAAVMFTTSLLTACFILAVGEARVVSAQTPAADDGVRLRRIDAGSRTAPASAVVVERGSLVHTAMLYPLDRDGRVQGGNDVRAQATAVLDQFETALRAAGTGLDRVARLHVYVADAAAGAAVDEMIARRFAASSRPALTRVESRMRHDGVLVAMDAIAATARHPASGRPERLRVDGLPSTAGAHIAIQPEGPFVIVSGRAAPGEGDAAATGTMAQLKGDLETAGLGFADVVQVKAFLTDMSRAAQLEVVMAATFTGTPPPIVVTEWRGGSAAVEIELVAAAPGARGSERVTFVEPISARYSRIARVFAGNPVFVSGLTGASPDPKEQVRAIFAELGGVVSAAGSDMRHIAKATYYVSDKGADEEINAIRPSIYDAARPPSASKISVQGVGRTGAVVTIDAIAVTVGR